MFRTKLQSKISQNQNENKNKNANLYSFQINGKKNLKAADESVRQAAETLKTAAEMICRLDDTMTKEEEDLCQRAINLRRCSEFTFKTVDNIKYEISKMA